MAKVYADKKVQKKIEHFLRDETGSQILEMVILFPILCFISFFVVVMGIVVFQKIVVIDASREAARTYALNYGMMSGGRDAMDMATLKAKEVMAAGGLRVGDTDSTEMAGSQYEIMDKTGLNDGNIVIKIEYRQPSPVPLMGALIGNASGDWNEFFLRHTATFKRENGGIY